MKKQIFYFLLLAVVVTIGCQKELSFEGSNTPAEGSLQAELTGDCLPKTVNGAYVAGTALVPATNTIAVQINVARTGTYTVYTDTVNGYYFRATGTFTTLGLNTVTLRSNGTPFAEGINNFVVNFDSTVCDIQVTVLPAGTGPAVFTLVSGGTPVNCASAAVTGTYVTSGALSAVTHYVDIAVNVTAVGTYTIKATGGGMTFQKTSTFAATGNATVRLDGSGAAPAAAGPVTVTFDAPFASCNFTVTVVAPVAGTLGGAPGVCTPVTPNGGPITSGVALTAGQTISVQITTASVGPYSVSTNTVEGVSFSASGTSTGATQTITLNNNGGTFSSGGTKNFTVSFGTSQCSFTLTVGSGAAYTIDCANVTVNGNYTVGVPLDASNTIDLPITVTTAGPYSITASINGMTFSASGTLALSDVLITLIGSNQPTNSGPFNLAVGTCSILITCSGAATIDWQFNIGATLYQGTTATNGVNYDPTPPTTLDYDGTNAANEDFTFGTLKASGAIAVNEQYRTDASTAMLATWYFFNTALDLAADPFDPSVNITIKITVHNTTLKVIQGTFSGTAFDAVSGTPKTITNGQFTARY